MTGRDKAGEWDVIPESDNENLDFLVSAAPKASRPSEAAGEVVLNRLSTQPRAIAVLFVPLLHIIASY